MSVELIRFMTNCREEMAFTHVDGNLTQGQFGDQYYRSTTDGRGVYLQPIVERKLLELDIQPGEAVSIGKVEQKDGRKRGIIWEVKRVDPPGDPSQPVNAKPPTQNSVISTPQSPKLAASTRTIHPEPKPEILPTQEQANTPKKPAAQETAPTTARPVLHTQMSSLLKGCLITAIDAARDAQAHSTQVGFPLTFGPGEVQAMAISVFIHLSKQSNIALMNQRDNVRAVNGGAPWPQ